MIVTGTEGGQWGEIWYVNPTFKHHFVGNLNVFKRVKHMMGVETRSGMNNFLFIREVGSVEMKTGNDTLRIHSVFYSPEIDWNVLSLDQLTLHGFTIRKSGDTCKILSMFSSPVVNSVSEVSGLTKEDELGLSEKRRLQDLCTFEEMVRWFLNVYMGITSRPVPLYSPNKRRIDLLSLYVLVARDGGYQDVTTNIWPIIAKDLGFDYQDGDYMRVIYAMYLDVLEYYYKFKSVQEKVYDKEMVNEEEGPSQGCHRRRKSTGDFHDDADSAQYALFAGNGWEDDWNLQKKRKRFNFNHMKKAVEDANRSVMQQASKHN
ncbi:putative transcription factor & chromatin remodeling ARID family [Helianthus annuus]|nr:putative transcription factor & chromatin remodeling ARID family [Helianthus annuus]